MKDLIANWRVFKVEWDKRWRDMQPKGNEALWLDGPTYRHPEFADFMNWLASEGGSTAQTIISKE